MEKFGLTFKVVAYSAIILFVVQIINLYLIIFTPSQLYIYSSAGVGLVSLLISVILNRNSENKK